MKKILFLLAMFPMMWSCSNSSNEPEPPKEEKIDIKGVWCNGDYFVTFSSDGYYTAYLDDKFIDSGDYIYNEQDKRVTCKNFYFNKSTEIAISSSNDKLICNFKSTNVLGDVFSKSMSFSKTDETPQGKNNALVGKTHQELYIIQGHGKCEWKFTSNYAATYSTIEVKPKTRNHFYIYREPYLYTQHFKPSGAGLSIFFNGSDKGDVLIYEVSISNGSIKSITSKKAEQ